MHGAALQELAIRTATELPDVTHEHPFGPEWDVLKVSGKVFLLVTERRANRSRSSRATRRTARPCASSTPASRRATT